MTTDQYSWRTVERTKSLLLYGLNKKRYIASCQIEFTGARSAFIHTLNGEDFYKIIHALQLRPFTAEKLILIRAEVTAGHVRLIEDVLQHLARVVDTGPSDSVPGVPLRLIEIHALQGTEADPGPSAWVGL